MLYCVHHNNMRYSHLHSIQFSTIRLSACVSMAVQSVPSFFFSLFFSISRYSISNESVSNARTRTHWKLRFIGSVVVDKRFSEANKRRFDASHRHEHLYSLVVAHSILIYLHRQYDFLLWPKDVTNTHFPRFFPIFFFFSLHFFCHCSHFVWFWCLYAWFFLRQNKTTALCLALVEYVQYLLLYLYKL